MKNKKFRTKLCVTGGYKRVIERNIFSYFRGEPDVMTVQNVCKVLHCSKNTVYEMLHAGRLECVKVGRRLLIPKTVLVEFLISEKNYEIISPIIPKKVWTSADKCGIVAVADGNHRGKTITQNAKKGANT